MQIFNCTGYSFKIPCARFSSPKKRYLNAFSLNKILKNPNKDPPIEKKSKTGSELSPFLYILTSLNFHIRSGPRAGLSELIGIVYLMNLSSDWILDGGFLKRGINGF